MDRKRSKNIDIIKIGARGSALAAAAMSLSACFEPDVSAYNYRNVDQCVAADVFTDKVCQDSFAEAQATHLQSAPRFETLKDCEKDFGANKCTAVPANSSSYDEEQGQHYSGGFGPSFVDGLIIGNLMNNGNNTGRYLTTPAYRDVTGNYYTGSGRGLGTTAFSGASAKTGTPSYSSDLARPSTARMQSRTTVVSRGGFGGGSRGFGG